MLYIFIYILFPKRFFFYLNTSFRFLIKFIQIILTNCVLFLFIVKGYVCNCA